MGDLGGSGASPGAVCSQCFRQGGFRKVLESDFGGSWLEKGAKNEPNRVPREFKIEILEVFWSKNAYKIAVDCFTVTLS